MEPSTMLVFKSWDSTRENVARRTLHCSFADAPRHSRATAPRPRRSLELRVACFWAPSAEDAAAAGQPAARL
jgi:hypothetical protein